jgi:putative phosphoesterase
MKIFVASDIHGSSYFMNKFAKLVEEEKPEQIILLGDLYYHGPRNKFPKKYCPKKVAEVLNAYKDKLKCVKGNCDAEVDQMIYSFEITDSYEAELFGKSFLFVHGHKLDTEKMPKKDFVFGGHTHVPVVIDFKGVCKYINPGSLSLPKGAYKQSYTVIEEGKITIKEIGGKIIETVEF